MFKVTNTPNFLGITISGDYQDLQALHMSLSNYIAFYFSNMPFYSTEDENLFLALCYDIRHAFQGDRNTLSVENNSENIAQFASELYDLNDETTDSIAKERSSYSNGNLYFSVDILYPWMLYYLYGLREIVDNWYDDDWFQHLDFHYTKLDAMQDRAIIEVLLCQFWKALSDAIGEKAFRTLWNFCEDDEDFCSISIPDSYVEWLCEYLLVATPGKAARKNALKVISYTLFGIETNELHELFNGSQRATTIPEKAYKELENNLNKLHAKTDINYMQFDSFCDKMQQVTKEHGPLYDDAFEEYVISPTFGKTDWDNIEW